MEMTKQQETKEKLPGLSSNGYYGTGGSGDRWQAALEQEPVADMDLEVVVQEVVQEEVVIH
jgi:hypothetical protein